MIARRFRRLAATLAVGVAALGPSACSSTASDAATITYRDGGRDHTVHIRRSDFDKELLDLAGNGRLAQLLKTTGLYANLGGEVSTDQQLSTRWLTALIRQAVVDEEIARARLQVTAQDRTNGVADQESAFTPAALNEFSPEFRAELVDRAARFEALSRYYQTCPSGRFVSHILFRNRADADAALALIRSGQKFDAIARARSTDTASGRQGGALGCLTPNEYVREFQDAAGTAAFDVVTGPVRSEFGYHLILVRRWDATADAQYAQTLAQAATAVVAERLGELRVWVNPRYGSWGRQADANGNTGFAVVPPPVPNPRVCREKPAPCTPATRTTTTVPAGG